MRSSHLLCAAIAIAVPASLLGGCGDDETTTDGDADGGSDASTSTSTTGTGGSGGGGGSTPGPEATDACSTTPGFALAAGETVTSYGSNKSAKDDYTSFCADATPTADDKDLVFAYKLESAGTVTFKLDDTGQFDGALSVRTQTCEVRAGGDNCANISADNETLIYHYEAGPIWVVVDAGTSNSEGDFTLSVSLAAPACGDGAKNPGEDCDPPAAGLCTAMCKFETPRPDAFETCPGEVVNLAPGVTNITGNTTIYADDSQSTVCITEPGGHDHVYQVVPTANGTLTATVGNDINNMPYCPAVIEPPLPAGCWDRTLYIRSGDCMTGTNAGCSDTGSDAFAVETVTIPVTMGTPYWVWVDGYNAEAYAYGEYVLRLQLQ